jgi:O-antigen/teichoic acid export membrane protein
MGSQMMLALVGLLIIPLIARGLGIEKYGILSLYIITIALLNNLDFGRVYFVERYATSDIDGLNELKWISIVNILISSVISLVIGLILFSFDMALSLMISSFFQTLSAPYFARLSINNKVGYATLIRNFIWSVAYVLMTVLIVKFNDTETYYIPLAGANIIVYFVYRKIFPHPVTGSITGFNFDRFIINIKGALSISWFNIVGAVLVSSDRMILKLNESQGNFGLYSAQGDLAQKLNMLSNAFGAAIYPALVSKLRHEKKIDVFSYFKRIYLRIYLLYFIGVTILIIFNKEILLLFYGDQFTSVFNVFPLLLFGFFINLNGFLFVSLSRALGDFLLPSKVYTYVAISVISFGSLLILEYGVYGAAATYVIAQLGGIFTAIKLIISRFEENVTWYEVLIVCFGILILFLLSISQVEFS